MLCIIQFCVGKCVPCHRQRWIVLVQNVKIQTNNLFQPTSQLLKTVTLYVEIRSWSGLLISGPELSISAHKVYLDLLPCAFSGDGLQGLDPTLYWVNSWKKNGMEKKNGTDKLSLGDDQGYTHEEENGVSGQGGANRSIGGHDNATPRARTSTAN